jgi:hypothetical protein
MALFGTSIGALPRPGSDPWWFNAHSGGWFASHLGFYVSVGLLLVGWIGVGAAAYAGKVSVRRALVILALWGVPLFLGPPLFSRDIYSYIAQGLLAHQGFNPYVVAPSALGHGSVLESVSKVWRNTPSPYGPLIVMVGSVTAGLGGHGMIAQVLAFRALELIGLALIVVSLPVIARRLGVDQGTAIWLGVLSPLALFSFVSSGHNDALMVGLMAAGVALALERHLRWGIVLCALAASIKLPALAAVVYLTADAMADEDRRASWRIAAEVAAITLAVIAAATLLAGNGWAWLGPKAFHIPTEIRVQITPTVALGTFVQSILHGVGLPVGHSVTITVVQDLCIVAAAAICVWLLVNVRRFGVVVVIGLALMAFVIASPTVWPWYWTWPIALLAGTWLQRSRALAALAALAMLLVGAGGTPMLSGGAYWVTVPLGLVLVGVIAWRARQGSAVEGALHGI